jgi:hypothetical protein
MGLRQGNTSKLIQAVTFFCTPHCERSAAIRVINRRDRRVVLRPPRDGGKIIPRFNEKNPD